MIYIYIHVYFLVVSSLGASFCALRTFNMGPQHIVVTPVGVGWCRALRSTLNGVIILCKPALGWARSGGLILLCAPGSIAWMSARGRG